MSVKLLPPYRPCGNQRSSSSSVARNSPNRGSKTNKTDVSNTRIFTLAFQFPFFLPCPGLASMKRCKAYCTVVLCSVLRKYPLHGQERSAEKPVVGLFPWFYTTYYSSQQPLYNKRSSKRITTSVLLVVTPCFTPGKMQGQLQLFFQDMRNHLDQHLPPTSRPPPLPHSS